MQSGVSYVGGYQGSPVSNIVDVLSEAEKIRIRLAPPLAQQVMEPEDAAKAA